MILFLDKRAAFGKMSLLPPIEMARGCWRVVLHIVEMNDEYSGSLD